MIEVVLDASVVLRWAFDDETVLLTPEGQPPST